MDVPSIAVICRRCRHRRQKRNGTARKSGDASQLSGLLGGGSTIFTCPLALLPSGIRHSQAVPSSVKGTRQENSGIVASARGMTQIACGAAMEGTAVSAAFATVAHRARSERMVVIARRVT